MDRIYPTATLRHLAQRKRLTHTLDVVGLGTACHQGFLRKLLSATDGLPTSEIDLELVTALLTHYLAQTESPGQEPMALLFAFVQAINFELTYGCNLACSHCLQDGLRPKSNNWLPTDAVIQALKDAQWLALTTLGVNFTGGEIFTWGSPILELLSVAQEIGIPARANTNATWGRCRSIKIGEHEFASDEDVVAALKQRQLGRLALSLDNRYDQYPHLLDRVIRVAVLCEAAQLTYEVVCTDPRPEIRDLAWNKLTTTLGHEPQYLLITPMEKVDVGGPARDNTQPLEAQTLVELAHHSPCATQGFYRPYFLHVAPHGGIRSCMNAPNGGWHGNITQQRLPEILNHAARNPVYQLFASDNLASFVETHLIPWQHLYKNINHGCTASAVIARIAEETHTQQTGLGRPLNPQEMKILHQHISQEYRLAAPQA